MAVNAVLRRLLTLENRNALGINFDQLPPLCAVFIEGGLKRSRAGIDRDDPILPNDWLGLETGREQKHHGASHEDTDAEILAGI